MKTFALVSKLLFGYADMLTVLFFYFGPCSASGFFLQVVVFSDVFKRDRFLGEGL